MGARLTSGRSVEDTVTVTTRPPGSDNTLQSIREELNRLYDAQDAALLNATYVGMTPAEAREFDIRRKRIDELCDAFIALTNSATRS